MVFQRTHYGFVQLGPQNRVIRTFAYYTRVVINYFEIHSPKHALSPALSKKTDCHRLSSYRTLNLYQFNSSHGENATITSRLKTSSYSQQGPGCLVLRSSAQDAALAAVDVAVHSPALAHTGFNWKGNGHVPPAQTYRAGDRKPNLSCSLILLIYGLSLRLTRA